jgi:ubiquinone/menaquinone biosynthesis C-methylase UbiE
MSSTPLWHYDEFRHCGVDYSSPAQAAAYDGQHQKFRDYKAAAREAVQALGIGKEHTVIDLGCGTGGFAIHAAELCEHVHAVDVSPAMLAVAQEKAQNAGVGNISFHRGGWMSYRHGTDLADAVVSTAVLHHLPDFWKLRGLKNAHDMLKPGGRLRLFDVVFPSGRDDEDARIGEWVEQFRKVAGEEFAEEVMTHVRDEHSTYDWIMEGLLTRAGFRIDRADYDGFVATYLCTRPK